MATVSTMPEVKRALLDEIGLLATTSATAAAPTYVQTAYARPPADRVRSESVFFGDLARADGGERRLKAGRQVRHVEWNLDLVVQSAIMADAEDAEQRAFVIAGAIENFLAANSQPAEWPNAPVASGAMSVVVAGIESELMEHPDGYQAVEVRIELTLLERLE